MRNSKGVEILFCIALLFLSIVISIILGSIKIEAIEFWHIITKVIPLEDPKSQILFNIRIPRTFLAVFIGASLSTSGALLQGVMQNPLADPGVIGVSSGASLAAVAILVLFPQYGQFVPLFAFAGAMLATFLVYIMAIQNGQVKPLRLVLAGVAINALFGGGNSLISVLNSDKIQSVILWLNGSLAGSSWNSLKIISTYS
ncbi:MAG: iron ABC transporter permease, partial [Neofamilia sp.]